MSGSRKPLKIGVRLEPPAIVCIYKQSNKLRMRVMPLRNVWPKTDTNFLFDDLRNRHGKYLESIPREMIVKMINIIKEHKQGMELQDILKKYESQSETRLKNFDDQRQTGIKFIESKKNELMKELDKKGNSEDEDQIDTNSKNRKVRSKFTFNKKSDVIFGKDGSNSDSDEYDFRNNKAEINFESDEDFEITKLLKDTQLNNKTESFKSTLPKNELTEVKNFPKLGIRNSSKNFTKEIVNDVINPKNKVKNQLKELLDIHDKIESPPNSKISKSEDDTDVEFDGSDIPLEEDYY